MKYSHFLFALVLILAINQSYSQESNDQQFDVVICGGTPAAIMAALALDKEGKSSVIIERTKHIGGLPANGLGATDIKTKGAVGGLFHDFISRVNNYYSKTYGNLSRNHHLSSHGYHFEPSVAEMMFEDMITAAKNITVLKRHQFDVGEDNISMEDNKIKSIRVLDRDNNSYKILIGKQFIDATYEGDLIAAAGAKYKIGRESKEEFDEPYAGKVYKYWDGKVADGTTYEADNAIQAFNYRLCLTNNPDKRIEIERPDNYNREEYVSLIGDVITGRHTGAKYAKFKKDHPDKVEALEKSTGANPPKVPGSPEGISRLVNLTILPNDKSDANNQQLAFISTDLPEENWFWPDGSWDQRDQFANRLKDYILGLFWFAQNDPKLPNWFKEDVRKWGLDKEEYLDNNYFPRQVYVREGRRLEGMYNFTANDAMPVKKDQRPPIKATSITAGHYSIDSHGVRKREEGRVNLDGFLSYGAKPFNVPYGVMVNETIENLIAPVPVSSTHLGFSAIRLEPTWMALGEASGLAASIGIDSDKPLQKIDLMQLQKKLLDNKAVLHYYEDLKPGDEGYKGFQMMGIHGIFPDWKVHPNKRISDKDLREVEKLLSLDLSDLNDKKLKRSELAEEVYRRL